MSRLSCLLVAVLVVSCAEDSGAVYVDAQWNLTCPSGGGSDCGSLAETCLGNVGQRAIIGEHGQIACTGDPIIASCDAVERPGGIRAVALEANLGGKFGFELRGASINTDDGSVEGTACNVTITENEVPYDMGGCGQAPPSMEQPCQLSNISIEGNDLLFDLECESILSSTTGWAFDVGAVGGGPTTIRFSNCTGF